MTQNSYVVLSDRGLLAIAGEDRRGFLQGLISNDIEKVAAERAIHAALLTAQGKYLHDFFVFEAGTTLVLDAEAARRSDLQRRLGLYRLRAKVSLAAIEDRIVIAAFGNTALAALGLPETAGAAAPFAGGLAFVDPRLPALGARLVVPADAADALQTAGFGETDFAAYDRLRLACGVPDGSRDLVIDKAILLESGFDELNGVDWEKGCYIGQELTARTKYRGLIKKRLIPVEVAGTLPAPGTIVMLDGQEAGEIRSGRDGLALALLRLDAVAAARGGGALTAGGALLRPSPPAWARF